MNKALYTIIGAGALYILGVIPIFPFENAQLILLLAAYLLVGHKVLWEAVTNLFHGQLLDENFLMALATIGAFVIGEYPEGVAVMLFYQVGEYFQDRAVEKSRRSISSLMDIRPDYAMRNINGELEKVAAVDILKDDVITVRPGERIPLDGIIIDGSSSLDTSALTGESLPKDVKKGDEILSGCINVNGKLDIRVTKEFRDSTVSKILDMVENATVKKSSTEKFITRFARYYTPSVVGVALIIAIFPPLLFDGQTYADWIYRALAFLVVSCPCALVISIPLSFFGGIGGASRKGILVKGSNFLEALAKTDTVVFDKTGTLTKGIFKVQKVIPFCLTEEELLDYLSHAESYSNHPIATSIRSFHNKETNPERISKMEEISGQGVKAIIDKKIIYAGNEKLMELAGVDSLNSSSNETVVHLAVDGKYGGCVTISDEIRTDAKEAIDSLKKSQIHNVVMLTGDNMQSAKKISDDLGIPTFHSNLLPQDKVAIVEDLLSKQTQNSKLVFVGDGINDAPVLARADIGIAMGGLGSDAAIEAADIVIMTDEPSKILTAIEIAKKTLTIAKQNTVFAIGIKFLVLLLAAIGYASMWAAVFADVGVAVLAILNSLRTLSYK